MDPAIVQAVWDRDRGCCLWCGRASEACQVAHVHSRGARPDLYNELANLCLLCPYCHRDRQHQRGEITVEQLHERLAQRYGYVYTVVAS